MRIERYTDDGGRDEGRRTENDPIAPFVGLRGGCRRLRGRRCTTGTRGLPVRQVLDWALAPGSASFVQGIERLVHGRGESEHHRNRQTRKHNSMSECSRIKGGGTYLFLNKPTAGPTHTTCLALRAAGSKGYDLPSRIELRCEPQGCGQCIPVLDQRMIDSRLYMVEVGNGQRRGGRWACTSLSITVHLGAACDPVAVPAMPLNALRTRLDASCELPCANLWT